MAPRAEGPRGLEPVLPRVLGALARPTTRGWAGGGGDGKEEGPGAPRGPRAPGVTRARPRWAPRGTRAPGDREAGRRAGAGPLPDSEPGPEPRHRRAGTLPFTPCSVLFFPVSLSLSLSDYPPSLGGWLFGKLEGCASNLWHAFWHFRQRSLCCLENPQSPKTEHNPP